MIGCRSARRATWSRRPSRTAVPSSACAGFAAVWKTATSINVIPLAADRCKFMEDQSLREAYRDLMRLNRQCFEAREFDIAYHCLMAALHSAQELKDIPYLREIEKTAADQLKHIDAHHPEYEHS